MPLSQKQMEYLALAWQCFDAEPKIDYEKFRAVAGLASAASARELMRVTKNKLRDEYGALGGAVRAANGKTPSSSSDAGTPKKQQSKKGVAGTLGSSGGGGSGPKKRGRKPAAAKAGSINGFGEEEQASSGDNDAEFDASPSKMIKTEPGEELQCEIEDGETQGSEGYLLL